MKHMPEHPFGGPSRDLVGVWRLQRLFHARGMPVTVFAGAVAVDGNPQVAAWPRDSHHEEFSAPA